MLMLELMKKKNELSRNVKTITSDGDKKSNLKIIKLIINNNVNNSRSKNSIKSPLRTQYNLNHKTFYPFIKIISYDNIF